VEHRLDGIALVSTSIAPAMAQLLTGSSTLVFVTPKATSLVGPVSRLPNGTVLIDEASGVEAAVLHLVERGYRDNQLC
jgi:DNA-binding LacI/PurR family transcriptional regulator